MRRRTTPDLLSGFWFLASVVALLGPLLAGAVIVVDKAAGEAGLFPALIISPDSARTILGSISGSLITIASLTSSLTIVTLQLLSNQYTPRTVRGFLSTRLSQVVLGSFIAIFLYCLVLLVSVRAPGDENEPFVPSLGVLLSLLLAVVGLILLVVFIHAMSQTIQVSTMAARIGADTASAIERVHGGGNPPMVTGGVEPWDTAELVRAGRTGYVRGVDVPDLLDVLDGGPPLAIHVRARPGDFLTDASVVASVRGRDGDGVAEAVRDAVVVEREREIRADPAYGIRQLVDITLRALSPGINDPSTAITCMGYLRALLEDLAARDLPECTMVERDTVRLSVDRPTFEEYLEPYLEIAGYAGTDARVVWTMLDGLDSIARCARDDQRRATVRDVRDELRQGALDVARLPRDRDRLAR